MNDSVLSFLILDDDELLRETTKNLLRQLGIERVQEAANGTAAMEILGSSDIGNIDIILCDLEMPGMDGMEFLRHLGGAQSNASVAIISSHDDALISMVGKMASAYGIRLLGGLRKPVSKECLSGLIQCHEAQASVTRKHKPQLAQFSLSEIMAGIAAKQFEPFYQPKVDFRTGQLKGAEALARWMHPEKGIVSPYGFIDTLEQSGSNNEIMALTFLILEKSALACKNLSDQGHVFPVSVNLSLNLLGDPALADKMIQVVHEAGINSSRIIFEVTESIAMKDIAHSLENLARLKMHGFGLSIDDYGTGFSNIEQLMRVPFSELKIDQSFIKDCSTNPEIRVIIKSSVEMAHRLKMECIAEGVETQGDWNMVKEMKCDTAQGYFIARPMDFQSFVQFCKKHNPEAFL